MEQQSPVLQGINRIFGEALSAHSEEELGRVCLAVAEDLTGAAFSFMGEINAATGRRDDVAISARGWAAFSMDDPAFPKGVVPSGFAIHGIYGRVLRDGRSLIANEPDAHPDRVGLPAGHPPLRSFLGVPLKENGQTVGMIGLGNRAGGFRQTDRETAEALVPAIMQALRGKRTGDALRERERLYERLVSASNQVLYRHNVDWSEMRQLSGGGFLADTPSPDRNWFDAYIHPEDQPHVWAAIREAIRTKSVFALEHRVRRADGTLGWTASRSTPVFDDAGRIVEWFGAASDITARKEAEAALRESETRLREAFAIQTVGVVFWDREFRLADANAAFLDMIGYTREEALGQPWQTLTPPEFHPASWKAIREVTAHGETAPFEKQLYRRDGSRWWGQFAPRKVGDQAVEFVLDVTERRTVAQERERLVAMLGQSQTMVCDQEGHIEVWSQGMQRLFGFTPAEAIGAHARALLRTGGGEAWAGILAAVRRDKTWQGEVRHRAKDGALRIVRETWSPQPGLHGTATSLVVAEEDQTAIRQAEDALRELNAELERRVAERTDALMAAEATLRQVQKMDAVGQLASGIAHDFNNMLQGIAGSLELARRRAEQNRPLDAARHVDNARDTVGRAATLTHRLLAFSRQQALDPTPVHLDALVGGMTEMIRRTVGAAVQLEVRLGGGASPVLCDASQLENALLNLCVNARDAMPDGGWLTILTEEAQLSAADVAGEADLAPGAYVAASVTDTGTGMPPEVVARVFEPFYTTKPLGQGTGLGLSQVYGFVRQSGGLVRLESAPGQGTTIRLFLPRHADAAPAEPDAGATVLLVEDEAGLRATATEWLRDAGYRVLEAADGAAALRLLHGGGRVDLLITDMGLPGGMNGRQLGEAARAQRPGLPVLFVTGYASTVLRTALPKGTAMIDKPFALDELAGRVRSMLETPEQ